MVSIIDIVLYKMFMTL